MILYKLELASIDKKNSSFHSSRVEIILFTRNGFALPKMCFWKLPLKFKPTQNWHRYQSYYIGAGVNSLPILVVNGPKRWEPLEAAETFHINFF